MRFMLTAAVSVIALAACAQEAEEAETEMAEAGSEVMEAAQDAGDAMEGAADDAMAEDAEMADDSASAQAITAEDVAAAQQAWGEGIVTIGEAYTNDEDYTQAARDHIEQFYAYDSHDVLFKPTLAADEQFRGDFDGALSYFVGGDIEEDGGFAIAPYTDVRWENEGTFIGEDADTAMAMGNYFFTTTEGEEVKVEYSFGYVTDENGDLKIVLHHSSLPYAAE